MTKHKVITDVQQITTQWLTEVLLRSGAIQNGAVTGFELEKGDGNWSKSAKLSIRYTDDALGKLPEKLFLKIVVTDLEDEFFGESEVTYYTRDYVDLDNAPIVPCHDAHYSAAEHCYHLLLEDISDTHIEAYKKPITLEYGLMLAEGLAALHAKWWGSDRLAQIDAPIHSSEHIRNFVEISEPGAERIIGCCADELKPHWPDTIRKLYNNHPFRMIERTSDDNGFTIIHGDLGDSNIMVPSEDSYPIYFIDRQPFNWSLTTWLGVYDIAYAIVLDWDVATCRELEIPVLEHYHRQLIERGIEEYSWEQLYDDYRLCAGMGVYIATEYCRGKINEKWKPVWMKYLKRSLTAIDDMNCEELWS